MEHADLYRLRETYDAEHILLCFNGPFSQGLIEEIGSALRKYMQSEAAPSSEVSDVFGVYIEITQNIQRYTAARSYNDNDASATVVIGRAAAGGYEIVAGNVVEAADGAALEQRIKKLAEMDKAQLKATYREQLRMPREDEDNGGGNGLGLIDIARKARGPLSCSLHPLDSGGRSFFSLRVVI